MGYIARKGGSEKAGDIKFHAANAVPPGWLKANGAAVSRSAYAALFLVVGTTYGAGDGATTFNLPDLRGEFVRGFDDGRGVDSGRVFGSAQASQMQSHTHTGAVTGATGTSGAQLEGGIEGNPDPLYNQATGAAGGTSNSSENRPRNVAALACIKY